MLKRLLRVEDAEQESGAAASGFPNIAAAVDEFEAKFSFSKEGSMKVRRCWREPSASVALMGLRRRRSPSRVCTRATTTRCKRSKALRSS